MSTARKDLDDKVNVHHRAIKAAERTGTNGGKPTSLHISKTFPTDTDAVTLWERIRRSFPQPEILNVAGRVIQKGLVVTPTMGLTIVLAIAGLMGTMYYRMSDQIAAKDQAYQQQRDMLIEIKTELRLSKEHDAEKRAELQRQIGDLYAWQQVTNKDLARVVPNRKQPQN